MKQLVVLMLALCAFCTSCGMGSKKQENLYRVTVSGVREYCPVVISDVPLWAASAVVTINGTEIPSQIDAPLHELCFVAHISGTQQVQVAFSSKPAAVPYPARVHAQMWLKNADKSLTAADTLCSDKDDMYRKLHHHGPAFESEYAAYRIYFDKKQTIDTYGKKQLRLELAETMWYPSDEQLAAGYGHDNLRVFGSVGVGALKGWDAEKGCMTHISDFKRREARILAKGPVRTVVEMRVEGWNYCGREIAMTSRYILYAHHADVQVENKIEGDFEGLLFTTGVMKMAEHKVVRTNNEIGVFGADFPENDTLKWERESVALAVAVPQTQIVSQQNDEASYLYQLRPDANGRINYTFMMAWRKSRWFDGRSNDECLLGAMNAVHNGLSPALVSRVK